jgi:hypothetical protein
MILRDRSINNNLLSFDEMNTFGKKGIGNESAYNQGYSLTKYIVANYGENVLKDISVTLSKPLIYSINKAIYEVLGVSGYELYDNWANELDHIYSEQLANINDLENYFIFESNGTTNIHPQWSPDSKQIAYLSNKENDYFSQTDLFLYNIADSTQKKIKSGVKTSPAWINDSLIVYSKISKPNENGSKFFDLYSYDLVEKKQNRLTEGMRLYSPVFNSKINKIYAVNTYDGTSNIFEGTIDSNSFKQITNFNDGIQIFSLSVKDSLIIFDAVTNHGRKINYYDINSSSIGYVDNNEWDTRDPIAYQDNLFLVDDRYGIFNLASIDKNSTKYLTNVYGGAFMPDISSSGKIVFSLYQNGGYKLAILDELSYIDNNIGFANNNNRPDFSNYERKENYYYRPTSDQIRYTVTDSIKYKSYNPEMSGIFILPRITYDYNTIKTGLYFGDNDHLNKMSILGGLSFNKEKDLDLFLMFDNNQSRSSYFFNFYWMSRNISRSQPYIDANGQVVPSINYDVNYSYQLFSTDLGNRFIIKDHKFWIKYTYSKYRQFYDVRQIQEYDFNGSNSNSLYGKGAYDYFRGHAITIDYEYEGRKPHYLYNMIPKSGFKINLTLSYEKNNLFEEFKVNEDYGGFIEELVSHNTVRFKMESSNHWKINFFNNLSLNPTITNNFKYFHLSNKQADDFLYFFGGGLIGNKGYTFYEPILQGPRYFLISNSLNFPIITQKSIRIGHLYLNSISIGLSHQISKSFNGKIMVNNIGYNLDDISNNGLLVEFQNLNNENNLYVDGYGSLQEYLDLNSSMDGLDKNNIITNNFESYLYPDIYAEYDDNTFIVKGRSIEELKQRYNAYKHSLGVEMRLLGFSFYSYPTALTYEYHIPISDPWNTLGKQYLRILFDFN